MERSKGCVLAIVAACLAEGLLLAGAVFLWLSLRERERGGAAGVELLEPGAPRESAIDLADARERIFEVEVPERTVALRLELASREMELLLQATRGGNGEEEGWDFSRSTDGGQAELTIGRFSDPPIEAGTYRVRVAWTSEYAPRTAERRLDAIPFRLDAEVVPARIDAVLEPGKALSSSIDEESGGFRSFRIDVPDGASALRIDLLEVGSDLDLYLREREPMIGLEDDVVFAQHFYGRESLVVDGRSGPWYVDVVSVLGETGPAPFKILATLARDPPAELLAIPPIPRGPGATPVSRALAAVVEIATDAGVGSGTILTSDGWILTNAHVVEALGGERCETVVVSASLDASRPPVELFRARVEAVDDERDLALVQATSGFYGQPLPEGYAFPTVALGDPDLPAIGDPIWIVGYPTTGGQGSRVSITCTRGVVSGYDTASFGTLIKTDAEVTNGNSGGAALDERGRIVGVATSVVEWGSGQVAYVHPLRAMPEGWRERMKE